MKLENCKAFSRRPCAEGEALDCHFSFAFQPIVDAKKRQIIAYEALVRGLNGQSADRVFCNVNDARLYRLEQACRIKAIALATRLGLDRNLNINFSPNALCNPELCICNTLQAADVYGFPIERLVFEITECEQVKDNEQLVRIIQHCRKLGFTTAIDDFGNGHSGLNLLAAFQPECIKIDRKLLSGVYDNPVKQAIIRGILQICRDLSIVPLAEGVENREEFEWLYKTGIELFQGYYFAKPGFETLPAVDENLYDIQPA